MHTLYSKWAKRLSELRPDLRLWLESYCPCGKIIREHDTYNEAYDHLNAPKKGEQ